jgi:hypothetical protein
MLTCKVFKMAIRWKAARSGFLDGFSAYILMFGRVRVPGSPSEELTRLTTSEALAEYRALNPGFADELLRFRDEALAHDRIYAWLTRVLGSIQLAAIIAAVCYLAAHHRF